MKGVVTRWTNEAWADYLRWREENRKVFERINRLVQAIESDPFHGLGKPEPLRHELAGYWSRRTTGEHRLVYRVEGAVLYIAQCRSHYKWVSAPADPGSLCGLCMG